MYNLLIALGVGVAITLGITLTGIGSIWAGIIPGTIGFLVTYFLLARRIGNQLQVLMTSVQKELQGQPTSQKEAQARVERAIKMLESGLAYEKWQFLVGPEIHSQIGMLKYMSKDLDGAKVHFAKASPRNYMAKAMEGALYFQRKDFGAMKKSFEAAVTSGKKEPLVWAVYAWCLVQNKEKDDALKVLGRGVEANPSDEKLKSSLSALQNDKRLKMKPYEPMWWQFGLEAPPPQVLGGGGGGRRVQFNPRR
ncbi:tetratricopeptide repeat protein [Archangium minus]|uniref:Tetratricopeptide repeat protein n=1 Tax=Archangium minus TaxID=83450 RepID=A0ABY9WWA8_9BACT|nr:tetratricopeptide repeat protein [Archangium violaceum]WNG47428.1 tetratricopeptide repeat protein [Archangium minus]